MQPFENSLEQNGDWKIRNLRDLLWQLLENKEWHKTLIIGELLNTLTPEDRVLHWIMGYAYLELHNLDKAEAWLQHAMELGDEKPDTLLLMARIAKYRGDLDGVCFWSKKAIEHDPENIGARFVLVNAYLGMGLTLEAELLFKDIIKLDPKDVQARRGLADIYRSAGRLNEAKEQLLEAIAIDPDNDWLYSLLGHVFDRLGDHEEAIRVFFKALNLDPDYALWYYNIGDAFLAMGNAEEGVPFLRKATEIDPYNSITHYDLGRAFLDLKKYEQAAIESNLALQNDPAMLFGRSNIGLSAMQNLGMANLNLGKYEDAEACFRKNLTFLAPNFFNLGLTLFRQKKYDESLKNFLWAVDLVPDDSEFWDLVGNAYAELNQLPEAIEALEKAIEVDNTYAFAHYDLGTVLSKIPGREDEAMESFHRAIVLDQNEPHPYYAITCIQALRNNKEPAFEFLEKTLEKGFTDWSDFDANTDLDNIRKDERYQGLKRKYPGNQTP
jgi:superkiller protein 3